MDGFGLADVALRGLVRLRLVGRGQDRHGSADMARIGVVRRGMATHRRQGKSSPRTDWRRPTERDMADEDGQVRVRIGSTWPDTARQTRRVGERYG